MISFRKLWLTIKFFIFLSVETTDTSSSSGFLLYMSCQYFVKKKAFRFSIEIFIEIEFHKSITIVHYNEKEIDRAKPRCTVIHTNS